MFTILHLFQIDDVDFETMRELVRFVTHGCVRHMDLFAVKLLIAADKYDINELKAACESFLCRTINRSNFMDLFAFAELYNA